MVMKRMFTLLAVCGLQIILSVGCNPPEPGIEIGDPWVITRYYIENKTSSTIKIYCYHSRNPSENHLGKTIIIGSGEKEEVKYGDMVRVRPFYEYQSLVIENDEYRIREFIEGLFDIGTYTLVEYSETSVVYEVAIDDEYLKNGEPPREI